MKRSSWLGVLENTKPELLYWSSQRDYFKPIENLWQKFKINSHAWGKLHFFADEERAKKHYPESRHVAVTVCGQPATKLTRKTSCHSKSSRFNDQCYLCIHVYVTDHCTCKIAV